MFPLLQVPGRVFELHPVVQGPPGIDGLLGDEAMAATTCVLVHPVHAALVHPASLVVVVGSNTVIGTAAEVIVDHPIDVNTVTHVHGQDHGEETSAEKST